MKVLVACEFSSVVREAFKAKGHEALSCDLLPSDIPGDHYQGDVLDLYDEPFDLMLCFPPCTYLFYAPLTSAIIAQLIFEYSPG